MRDHNHSFLRFIIDLIQIFVLFVLLLSPVLLITTLKIKDFNLKASVTEFVAGVKSTR